MKTDIVLFISLLRKGPYGYRDINLFHIAQLYKHNITDRKYRHDVHCSELSILKNKAGNMLCIFFVNKSLVPLHVILTKSIFSCH